MTISEEQAASFDPLHLGVPLYMPGDRADLEAIFTRRKRPELQSILVCLEDAVHECDVAQALRNLQAALDAPLPAGLRRFVRPRDSTMLDRLMRFDNIDRIDGFVLPKVTEHTLAAFAEAAARQPTLRLMPTIETDIAFDRSRLRILRQQLQIVSNPILCVRIGGNDLMRLLRLHRPRRLTLYDTPLRSVIDDLIKVFRPAGFALAAPVCGDLDDPELLAREVALDTVYGLAPKAALTPKQIPVIEYGYRVYRQDCDAAAAVLAEDARAVFKTHGQMLEVALHREWAAQTLIRARVFGVLEN